MPAPRISPRQSVRVGPNCGALGHFTPAVSAPVTAGNCVCTLWRRHRSADPARRWQRGTLQTLEPYVDTSSGQPPGRRGPGNAALVALGVVAVLAISLLAVVSKIGVIVVLSLAVVAATLLFVFKRGFGVVEVAAFLIHFDGLGRGVISIGRIFSGFVIILLIYKLVVERWRPPAVPMRYWLPPVLLLTWGVASAAWAPETGQWVEGVGIFGLAFSYFAVTAFMVDSYDTVKKWMRAYWYGGIFGAVAGVWGLLLGLRSYGLNGDANLFGIIAASMIPLTIYYRRQSTTTKEKVIYTLVLLLVLGGAAGAGSRSGVIAAAAVLFATMMYRPGISTGRKLAAAVPAILVTAVIAVVLLVANPNTLVRGTDSSGRTDFWNVSFSLIEERPLLGVGLGNVDRQIPGRLATTPGNDILADSRDEVTSHNAYLDMLGDLGVIGLGIFLFILVMTILGLLRPRWKQTKESSVYLLLMFIPALTGSMFVTIVNNKLAWSIIGLSAALQIPSWGTRWKGYFTADDQASASTGGDPSRLARWDLRVSQRFRIWVIAGAAVGAFLFPAVASRGPTFYTASLDMFVPKLDLPPGVPYVRLDVNRVQYLHNLVLAEPYAYKLAELSGVEPWQVSGRMEVARNKAGPVMRVTFRDTDPEVVEAVGPHLIETIDAIIAEGREWSEPVLQEELRPQEPGEQRYYTGPMFLPIGGEVERGVEAPQLTWLFMVGGLTGGMVALSLVLLKQGRPRVNNDDDFPHAVGMPLWTHVGRNGRRNAATPAQYAQVVVTAFESTDSGEWPRRMVLAAPRHNRSTRVLAMGMAASLASAGEKVLLVDGQPYRPLMSWRLGAGLGPGMNDIAHGRATLGDCIRRVRRWSMPRPVRAAFRKHRENLRFVPAGRRRRGEEPVISPAVLDQLDEDVIVVMLAPPLLGTVPVSPSMRWASVVLYNLVEGETVTSDAEDAALQVSTFALGPSGVVLSDV
jgi:O-antigen ligase